MQKEVIMPSSLGRQNAPYSEAIATETLIFCSGQVAVDPTTGKVAEGGIQAQTRQVLENLKAVLRAGGSGLEKVVKATIFMEDVNDFAQMNEVYREYFPQNAPARSCVGVSGLVKGEGNIEIELIAIR